MARKHHYTCRCNVCVRQRNARIQRREQRDIEDGNLLPAGSYLYETSGDHPVIDEDEVAMPFREDETYRNSLGGHTLTCTCADCVSSRMRGMQGTHSPARQTQGNGADELTPPQGTPSTAASSSSQSGRWRWFGAGVLCVLLLAAIAAGIIYYRVGPDYLANSDPEAVPLPLPATPTATPEPTATLAAPAPTASATPVPTATLPPVPTFTPPPTPTATPVPPTEEEVIVNAFAECNGQYSGRDKRFRAYAASRAIAEGRQTTADVRELVVQHCDGVIPALPANAGP